MSRKGQSFYPYENDSRMWEICKIFLGGCDKEGGKNDEDITPHHLLLLAHYQFCR